MSTVPRNGLYAPGDVTTVLVDLFPAAVTPRPEGVPATGKLRAVVTTNALTLCWLAGRDGNEVIVGRADFPLEDADTAGLTHQGGTVGPWEVVRGAGCSCGAAGLKNWQPFPDVKLQRGTRFVASVNDPSPRTRYSRA